METKVCKGCKKEFTLSREFFYIDRAQKDGYKNVCIGCAKKRVRVRKIAKEGHKFCSKCERVFPATVEYFIKENKTKSGLSSQCKECRHEYYLANREYIRKKTKEYYEENKELVVRKQKEYQEKNKEHKREYDKIYTRENKEKILVRTRKYVNENKKEMKKYWKMYYQKNKEHIYKINQRWKEKNAERVRMASKRRRNKKADLISDLTLEQWEWIKKHFNNECVYCGEEKPLEQDHFVPLSKGGGYTVGNIVPACRSCNASKNNSDFEEWYKYQETYDKSREKKIKDYLRFNKKQIIKE